MLALVFDTLGNVLDFHEDLRGVYGPYLPQFAPGVLHIVILCTLKARKVFAAEEATPALVGHLAHVSLNFRHQLV